MGLDSAPPGYYNLYYNPANPTINQSATMDGGMNCMAACAMELVSDPTVNTIGAMCLVGATPIEKQGNYRNGVGMGGASSFTNPYSVSSSLLKSQGINLKGPRIFGTTDPIRSFGRGNALLARGGLIYGGAALATCQSACVAGGGI